jgi:predicted peptidase
LQTAKQTVQRGRVAAWAVLAAGALGCALGVVAALAAELAPGKTVVPHLRGRQATNQLELLERIRLLPKQVTWQVRTQRATNASNDALRYRLWTPPHLESNKTYPLVLFLHGGAPRKQFEDVLEPHLPGLAYGIGRFVAPETQANHPCFVLVPWSNGRAWDGVNLQLILDALETLRREFPIDTNRLYVTGQSMGGIGAWALITEHPGIFAAAVPVCGAGNPAAARVAKDVPVWTFHGTADTTMPVSYTRDMVKTLLRVGGKPVYWEYDGGTHSGTAERAYCEPNLVEWLFAQRKR